MRTRKKWLWLIFGIAAIVAGALTWSISTTRPPIILTLPTGDRYRFVGITYGTNTVPPGMLAKLLNFLPVKMANAINTRLGSPLPPFPTGSPSALPVYRFWFKRLTPTSKVTFSPPTHFTLLVYRMLLADQGGNIAGESTPVALPTSSPWAVIPVNALPRRSPVIKCGFYASSATLMTNPVAEVTVPNPFYGRYPQWTPEPVPTVKRTGDLEVRLNSVSPERRYSPPLVGVACNFSVRSPDDARWVVNFAELSDATSNKMGLAVGNTVALLRLYGQSDQMSQDSWQNRNVNLPDTLWPGENAWRLRLDLKRVAGFASNELITLSNVPVPVTGTSNYLSITNDGKIMNVVLSQRSIINVINGFMAGGRGASRRTSLLQIQWQDMPADSVVDFVDAETDAGALQPQPGVSSPRSFVSLVLQPMPINGQITTITFAIQKIRSVEFLVKPPTTN